MNITFIIIYNNVTNCKQIFIAKLFFLCYNIFYTKTNINQEEKMDIFVEQIVKKETSGKDWALRVLIGIGIGVLSAVSLFIFFFMLPIPMAGLLLVCGICFGGYHLMTGLDCEYEYIVTNGEIDFDKIVAKRKRSRLITAKVSTFEAFGEYTENTPAPGSGVTIVSAVGINEFGGDTKPYYADFRHASAGNVRVIFTPEEKVIDAIVPFLPRQIKVKLDLNKKNS